MTIRLSLTTSLLTLVVLLSLAIFVANVVAGRRIAADLGSRYLEATERLVDERLVAFLAPAADEALATRARAKAGLFDPHDPRKATALLLPFLRAHPQVVSVATGDDAGYGYLISADEGTFLQRVTDSSRPGVPARFVRFTADGTVVKEYEEQIAYDVRTRPWFADAKRALAATGSVEKTDVVWGDPYILFTSQQPGIGVTLPYESAAGDVYMVTFNVMLARLSDFTASLRPTPHGMVELLSAKGEVVGFPSLDGLPTAESRRDFGAKIGKRLPTVAELRSPILSSAYDRAKDGIASREAQAFRVDVGGEAWRTSFRPKTFGNSLTLWTHVMVPESDFLAEVARQRKHIVVASVAAVVLAGLLAWQLARVYARPLRQLAGASARITTLDLSPGEAVRTHLREAQELADAQERMRGALDSFARYVPTPVVRTLLERGEAARLGGRVRTITVMFSDIREFTRISERLGPDALTTHLGEYFEHVMRLVAEEGGAVDKVVGDSVMSLWGAPVEHPDHAARAVRSALRQQEWLAGFETRCRAEGRPPLRTAFGLATGSAFVGNIGAPNRLNFTAIGDIVNLASRLEGACKVYGTPILAADGVRVAAGPGFAWRTVDVVAVKGKSEPVRVCEPLGLAGAVPEETLAFARAYEAALEDYLARRFGKARSILESMRDGRAADVSVRRLVDLCRRLEATPPPVEWDGVARLETK
jgi:adenylate cyclase